MSQYVGENVQPFNKRMNGHRSDLTKKTILTVSQHFVSPGHSLDDFGRSKIYIIEHNPPVVLLWNTCACCNWRQHLQRLSPHGLHWLTIDEDLDTAALTSVSLMLLGRRNPTTGGSESVHPFNKRMNGHRSDLTTKTFLPVSQHFVSPGHSLDDFGRSKIYIIDHNLSWKENQRQKREFLDPRVTNITSGRHVTINYRDVNF
jgi:predicted lipase